MSYSTVGRVDGEDAFFYSPKCNGADHFAIPEGDSKVWAKWQRFFDNLPTGKRLTLEITFEGKLKVENAYLFGSLDGWARAEIQIQRIVAIRDASAGAIGPDSNVPRPEIERVKRMRGNLNLFVESLHSPSRTSQYLQHILPEDFLFTDAVGSEWKKEQYLSLNAPWLNPFVPWKELSTGCGLKTKAFDTIVWRSRLKLVLNNGATKDIYCDITFTFRKGDWVLTHAAMI